MIRSFALIAPDETVETVSVDEWLHRIRSQAKMAGAAVEKDDLEALLETVPAIKLLGFYEGLATSEEWRDLGTEKT